MIGVFWLSAIVHEYIIIVAFKFFYPVLFVEFFIVGGKLWKKIGEPAYQ